MYEDVRRAGRKAKALKKKAERLAQRNESRSDEYHREAERLTGRYEKLIAQEVVD